MPTEIGLADGTVLTLEDENTRPDDVLNLLRKPGNQGYVEITSTNGSIFVNPSHVVSVRWKMERSGTAGFH